MCRDEERSSVASPVMAELEEGWQKARVGVTRCRGIRLSASDLFAAGKVYLAVDLCGPNVLCWVGIVFLQPDGGFHWCRQRSRGCPISFSFFFWFMNEFPFFGCWGFLGVFWNDFGLGLPGLGCSV